MHLILPAMSGTKLSKIHMIANSQWFRNVLTKKEECNFQKAVKSETVLDNCYSWPGSCWWTWHRTNQCQGSQHCSWCFQSLGFEQELLHCSANWVHIIQLESQHCAANGCGWSSVISHPCFRFTKFYPPVGWHRRTLGWTIETERGFNPHFKWAQGVRVWRKFRRGCSDWFWKMTVAWKYLKLGTGEPWAGQFKLVEICWMTLNSNDFETEENFGAAEPTGSGNYALYCLGVYSGIQSCKNTNFLWDLVSDLKMSGWYIHKDSRISCIKIPS